MNKADQIEQDIERTRHKMDHTLDEVGERVNPRNLWEDVLDMFRSSDGSECSSTSDTVRSIGKNVVRQVKRHPVPALLCGVGLAWLAFESSEDEDHETRRTGQWRNLPEHSGSFVDARTGQPYSGRYAVSAAWDDDYDWSDEEENTWQDQARQATDTIRQIFSDTTKSAREKLQSAATHVQQLRGDKYEQALGHWRDLREHSGSFVDARTGEPYNEHYGEPYHPSEDLEYLRSYNWSEEDEQTWSDKAHRAVENMQRTLSNTRHNTQKRVKSLASQLSGFAGMMKGRAARTGSQIGHGAQRFGETASGWASQAQHQGARMAHGVQNQTSQAIEEYPLAVAAACLGLGMFVGLALPPSRQEDRWFGDASDDVKRQAKETGRAAVERGKRVAQETGQAAMEEAERQGLTPGQLGEKVRESASHIADAAKEEATEAKDIPEKAKKVAKEAAKTAKRRSKQETVTS